MTVICCVHLFVCEIYSSVYVLNPPMAFYFQSMDGFALVLGADGRLLYVSETVSIYLGLSQVRLNIF